MGGHSYRMPIVAGVRRFAAVTVLVVTVLAILNIVGLFLDQRVFDPQVSTAVRLVTAVGEVHEAMLDQETGLRGWQIAGEDSFLAPYEQGSTDYRAALGRAYGLAGGDQALTRLLSETSAAAGAWTDGYAVPQIARRNIHPDAASLATGKRLFDDYRHAEQRLQQAVAAASAQALRTRTTSERLLTVVKLALIVLLLVPAALWRRRARTQLADPVDEILAGLTLYQRGDLTASIDVQGTTEMAAIARQAEALASAVLAHREAIEEQRRSAQSSDELHQRALVVARELTGLLDRSDIVAVLLPAVAELAGAQRVSLVAVEGDRPARVVASVGDVPAAVDSGLATAHGLARAGRLLQPVAYRTETENLPALALPLGAGGRLHGLLKIVTASPLGTGHVDALQSLALAAGAAMATAEAAERLADESRTDALTELHNRRRLDEDLPREIEVCRRTGRSAALLLLDVDHFKAFNDSQGHPAGDRLLAGLGEVLRETLRTADSAYRYGGEEFAVLLRGVSSDEAAVAAERLRQAVLERLPVTISVGAAVVLPEAPWPVAVADLVAAADGALYEAKASGRNRVCVAAATETVG